MKITDGKVIVCSPGRNFVTLKLETEDGVYGLGDATLNGRELAVASYLTDHVMPLLIGRDARRIEDIWQLLYKGAYWRRGPVTMSAIAAVDTALWDIKGKALDAPVYQLLGGASREAVMVYGHASGDSIDETAGRGATIRRARLQGGAGAGERARPVAHLRHRQGRRRLRAGRARTAVRRRCGAASATCSPCRRCSSACARELGPDVHLLHDVHHRLTPIEAGRLGRALEPYHLFWMEDPTPAENQEAFRLIRQHTTTPLAVGEVFNSIHDCRQLHAGAAHRLHPHDRRARRRHQSSAQDRGLAELYQVRTGSHGATDLSPVCMAAALHFDLSVHNFGIQEYMPHTAETNRVFPHAYTFEDGVMHPGDAPGLGVDLDETLAATFPYEPAYLPVARLLDGTVHNW